MQADGDDIIFADLAGVTQDYWIESGMNTNATKIWVEVKSVDASSTKDIYLYYGNAGAGIASNGPNTFIQWHGSSSSNFIDSLIVDPTEFVYEIYMKPTSSSQNLNFGVGSSSADKPLPDGVDFKVYSPISYIYLRSHLDGVETYTEQTATPLTQNTYYRFKLIKLAGGVTYYMNGSSIGSEITTNLPDSNIGLYMFQHTGTMTQNWSFVRKYTAIEPTHGTWGSEETESGPAVSIDIQYLPILTTTIDTAITNARTGANNKYFNVPIVNDVQIMFIHISQ